MINRDRTPELDFGRPVEDEDYVIRSPLRANPDDDTPEPFHPIDDFLYFGITVDDADVNTSVPLYKRVKRRSSRVRHKDAIASRVMSQNLRAWENKYPGLLDEAEYREWHAAFKGTCAYCGLVTHTDCIEHVVPLSRDGANTIYNVVPACATCNSSKGAMSPWAWMNSDTMAVFIGNVMRALKLHERRLKRKAPQ